MKPDVCKPDFEFCREGEGRYQVFLVSPRMRLGLVLGKPGIWLAEDPVGNAIARYNTRKDAAKALLQSVLSRENLRPYRVSLKEEPGDKFTMHFECWAEDADHAAEQALVAYPTAEIVHEMVMNLSTPPSTLYHGTSAEFSTFRVPPSGVHVGTFDQAVHAATMKLARMAPGKFASLEPDASGWPGTILMVSLKVKQIKDVDDAKTAIAWARAIKTARAQGFDCLRYINAFEGREPAPSYVVFDQGGIEITGCANR